MEFILNKKLADEILNYLQYRPYKEVYNLIGKIMALTPQNKTVAKIEAKKAVVKA